MIFLRRHYPDQVCESKALGSGARRHDPRLSSQLGNTKLPGLASMLNTRRNAVNRLSRLSRSFSGVVAVAPSLAGMTPRMSLAAGNFLARVETLLARRSSLVALIASPAWSWCFRS